MQEKLHDHIIFLEEKIQTISDSLTNPRLTTWERGRCKEELCVAEAALAHYRAAYDLERGLN